MLIVLALLRRHLYMSRPCDLMHEIVFLPSSPTPSWMHIESMKGIYVDPWMKSVNEPAGKCRMDSSIIDDERSVGIWSSSTLCDSNACISGRPAKEMGSWLHSSSDVTRLLPSRPRSHESMPVKCKNWRLIPRVVQNSLAWVVQAILGWRTMGDNWSVHLALRWWLGYRGVYKTWQLEPSPWLRHVTTQGQLVSEITMAGLISYSLLSKIVL